MAFGGVAIDDLVGGCGGEGEAVGGDADDVAVVDVEGLRGGVWAAGGPVVDVPELWDGGLVGWVEGKGKGKGDTFETAANLGLGNLASGWK